MTNLRLIVGVALIAVVFGCAAATFSRVLWDAWIISNQESSTAMAGAFAGAFFALVFVRLGEALNKIYSRSERNQTSLIRLQHYVNDCMNVTNDNVFIAKNCLGVFDEAVLLTGQLPVFMNVPLPCPIDKETPLGLTNIDFLNEVYSLNVDLKTMNDSMATIDRAYSQIRDAFIQKSIDPPTYLENARRTRERYRELAGFLMELQKDLVRTLATSRILMRRTPFFISIVRLITQRYYGRKFPHELAREIARVEQEIAQVGKDSAARVASAQRAA